MSKNKTHLPPALKHGCYSGLTLLPTEDRAAFETLHRDLVAEYAPNGRSEEITIENVTRLTWRRENLAIYVCAQLAREKRDAIYSRLLPPLKFEMPLIGRDEETRSPEELSALRKELEQRAQRELGSALELAEIGEVATYDHLEKELALIDRLDGMIVRQLKQFLLIRGVKSVSASACSELSPPRIKKAA